MSIFKHSLMLMAAPFALLVGMPIAHMRLPALGGEQGYDGNWGYRRSNKPSTGGAMAYRRWKTRRRAGITPRRR